ncbi:NAD(P)/FAD-dependent oxidoreductase [candidate division KSB1 bacterium]
MKNAERRYLILGNSVAAVGAVEAIRSIDEAGIITLLSAEPHHTYSRPLISYLLAGDIKKDRMYFRPKDFYSRNNVDARLGLEAVAIDVERRKVETGDGGLMDYDKLLLAVGGKPFIPKIDGLKTGGVFNFITWDDAKKVDAYLKKHEVKRAVVLGAGLIGIKAVEALAARKVPIALVELADRVLVSALDSKGSQMAREELEKAGVDLHLGATLTSVQSENGRVRGVKLSDGAVIDCDLLIVAVGVAPNLELAAGTSIEAERGIVVDEHMQTTVPDIFAAGDVIQIRDSLLGDSRPMPLFPHAHRQGRTAGFNMAGVESRFEGAFAMNSIEVMTLPTVSVGITEPEGDGYDVLTRFRENPPAYKKIVLRDNRIVGAVFVGDIDRSGIITGLIKQGVDTSDFKQHLLTDEFGLLSLPSEYRKHVVSGEGVEV